MQPTLRRADSAQGLGEGENPMAGGTAAAALRRRPLRRAENAGARQGAPAFSLCLPRQYTTTSVPTVMIVAMASSGVLTQPCEPSVR